MKKNIAVLFILFFSVNCFSQVDLRAGMGIQFQSTPSLTDYINFYHASSSEQQGTYGTSVNFSLEGGYWFSSNREVSLEIAYLINSYNFNNEYGYYNLSYNIIMPSVLYYFIVDGDGYNFKFGGGAGIRFVNAEEQIITVIPVKYSSTGFGFVLRADGNTLLGGNFYANIGGDIRYDLNGEPKNNGRPLTNRIVGENVNFNSFSFGLRLGITYKF